MRSLALAPIVLSAACFSPDHQTEVRLRDPHAVRVDVETPTGTRTVLAEGVAPAEIEVPRMMPPYFEDELKQSFVLRDDVGTVMLRCDTCVRQSATVLVPRDGVVVLSGTADRVVRGSDAIAWSVVQHSWVAQRRGGFYDPILTVQVRTSLSNVVSVTEKRVLSRKLGGVELLAGALIGGLGATIIGVGATRLDPGAVQTTVVSIGSLFALCGALGMASGFYYLLAPESSTIVFEGR